LPSWRGRENDYSDRENHDYKDKKGDYGDLLIVVIVPLNRGNRHISRFTMYVIRQEVKYETSEK
jgi:hypothetical protein